MPSPGERVPNLKHVWQRVFDPVFPFVRREVVRRSAPSILRGVPLGGPPEVPVHVQPVRGDRVLDVAQQAGEDPAVLENRPEQPAHGGLAGAARDAGHQHATGGVACGGAIHARETAAPGNDCRAGCDQFHTSGTVYERTTTAQSTAKNELATGKNYEFGGDKGT